METSFKRLIFIPDAVEPPPFKSEKDIFDFVGLVYKEPSERTGASAVVVAA
jgi:hypothetical protein